MKKVIAMMLVLILALALVACGGKKEEEGPKHYTVGFNTNGLTNETMSCMVDVFKAYCDSHNMSLMTSQDGGDTATMLNNLENMVAGGCDGIIFMNHDPAGSKPMVNELAEKGIKFVSYDEYSDACEYSFLCSYYDLGYAIGKMAADWANDNITGLDEIVFGMLSVEVNSAATDRSNGIEDGIKENCPKARVIRVPAGGGLSFVDAFYNMLAGDPDIHVFASLADSMVIQVAEAWYGDLSGSGADISQYGVFSTDATDIALNLIKQAQLGKGIMRGTIDLGLKDRVPTGMITCLHAALEGKEPEGYEKTNYYTMKLVMEDNVDEYSQYFSGN